jgi:crooked neck
LRVAKFEEKHNNRESCRRLYESALADLKDEVIVEDFFISFIKFEMRQKEYDRCRALFKFGLDNIAKEKSQKLYKYYVKFEKMHGSK